jgi:hypothetical protein
MNHWDQQHRVFFQYLIAEENLLTNQTDKVLHNLDKLVSQHIKESLQILHVEDHRHH